MTMIRFPDVGSVGYIADIPDNDLPEQPLAWSSARNFVFRNGLAERAPGYKSGFGTVQQIPYWLTGAITAAGVPYVVAASTGKVHSYTGITNRDITKSATTYAATADTRWTGGELTGFVVLNNSVDAPQSITISTLGSGNLVDLTNFPANTTCGFLRPWKYYLVMGNTTESSTNYPYKIWWSQAATPGTLPASWTASATNDAGSVDLSGGKGKVVDAYNLADQLAIYREQGIVMMRYVGGTDTTNRLVMAFNAIETSGPTGILSNNCVGEVPGAGHCVLGNNDVYIFNGSSTSSILNGRWRDSLFNQMDRTNRKRSFVVSHPKRSEVWICFPTTSMTSCDKALIWNYADNTLGYYDLPSATSGLSAYVDAGFGTTWSSLSATAWSSLSSTTWASMSGNSTAPELIFGTAGTKIHVIGGTSDANGSTFTSQLERTGISLGDGEGVKFLRGVWPRFDGPNGQSIDITVGVSMSPDEGFTYGSTSTYTLGSSRKIDTNVAGRYMAVRMRSTSGSVWRLRGLDLDIVPMGMY